MPPVDVIEHALNWTEPVTPVLAGMLSIVTEITVLFVKLSGVVTVNVPAPVVTTHCSSAVAVAPDTPVTCAAAVEVPAPEAIENVPPDCEITDQAHADATAPEVVAVQLANVPLVPATVRAATALRLTIAPPPPTAPTALVAKSAWILTIHRSQ